MISLQALKTYLIFKNFYVSLRISSQEKWMFYLTKKRDGETSYKGNSNPRPQWKYEMEAIVVSNNLTKTVECLTYFLLIYHDTF